MNRIYKMSFNCNECGKYFEIKGYWFNQFILEWYLNYKYMWHKILKDKHKIKVMHFILMNIIWIPLVFLQIISILLEPFRRIL